MGKRGRQRRKADHECRLDPALLGQIEHQIHSLMAASPEHRDTHWQIDNAFHDLIAGAAGNQTAQQVLHALRQRTCVFDHKLLPDRFLQGCMEHLHILHAVRAGDPDAVQHHMTRHIEQARDAVLARDPADARFFANGKSEARWQFDLPGYCAARLAALDVAVSIIAHDTLADEARFFSHRRNTLAGGGPIGHQLSAIMIDDRSP